MKLLHRTTLALALTSIWGVSNAAPPPNSPYYTDVQTQYPKDRAQDTFQMASFLTCFMKAMAPELSVGVGEYLAYVDESMCEDNGGTANTATASGGSSVAPPDYAKVLVNVTQGAQGELNVEAKVKLSDQENGRDVPKHILAKGIIYSGPAVTPPYGDWRMDFCSSLEGNAGSCDDGIGYVRVTGSGISVFNRYDSSNWRSGKSVFTGENGISGYGKVTVNEPRWSDSANKTFAFAPNIYLLRDRITSNENCYNPSTSAEGVRFNSWDTFLYDQSTGERLVYQNPGFNLKSNLTGYTVGSVDYWGVNFWREANAADQLAGAVLVKVGDESQTFTLRKTAGRLNRTTTTSSTGLSSIDGVPLNFGGWGWNNSTNQGVGTAELLRDIGVATDSNSLSLIGYWSSADGRFVITGYQSCNNSCSITNLSTPATRTTAQLKAFGFNYINAWVNGINANYQFDLKKWENGGWVEFDENTLTLVKNSSEVVSPNDPSIPALVCVDWRCPDIQNGQLVDKTLTNGPATAADIVNLTWDPEEGGPKITVGGITKLVDWRTGANAYNSHYYQLYNQSDLPAMVCGPSNDRYCPDQVRRLDSSVYYSWQTGGEWDAYNYLVYRTGGTVGSAVKPSKPIPLTYTVAQTRGTIPSYIGKTITVESPRPGTLWLPGNCIDASGNEAQCSKNTDWVNSVVIPFAADSTGEVTRLNDNGQPTSTKYYVKWLQRGVYFETLDQSNCSTLTNTVAQAENLELPGIADFNQSIRSIAWPDSGFDGVPRVIHGVLQ